MSTTTTQIVPVTLGGAPFHVEARASSYADVGVLDAIPFDAVMNIIAQLGTALNGAIEKAAPKKAAIEFGMAVEIEGGKLVALVCQGKTSANFTVKLEWER